MVGVVCITNVHSYFFFLLSHLKQNHLKFQHTSPKNKETLLHNHNSMTTHEKIDNYSLISSNIRALFKFRVWITATIIITNIYRALIMC